LADPQLSVTRCSSCEPILLAAQEINRHEDAARRVPPPRHACRARHNITRASPSLLL